MFKSKKSKTCIFQVLYNKFCIDIYRVVINVINYTSYNYFFSTHDFLLDG